jgi:sialic acid synthase SpsE
VNHNGKLDLALQLIDIASEAGADAVKFQKRSVEKILTKEALNQPYISPTSLGKTYGEHRKALELQREDYEEIVKRCRERGIIFLASAWDQDSVDFLEQFDVVAHKIASADLTNLPLIEYIAKIGKPVILSTGMSEMHEVDRAVNLIKRYNEQLILLHCTSTYPSRFEEINLRIMRVLRERFDVLVGYSGHELGIAVSTVAAALGAVMVERHFTVDRTLPGPDHAASLEPQGLRKMIRDIRAVERAMGTGEKRILERELPIRRRLTKSIVATKDIPAGTLLQREMLCFKSPGDGLNPGYLERIIGKRVVREIKADTSIKKEDIEYFEEISI